MTVGALLFVNNAWGVPAVAPREPLGLTDSLRVLVAQGGGGTSGGGPRAQPGGAL